MMKFNTLFIAGLFCICCHTYSQTSNYFDREYVFETGISVGPMNSLTDLGGRRGNGTRGLKDFRLQNSTFSGGVYGRVFYKNFGIRLEATLGRVKGSDNDLESVKSTTIDRYNRNLSFRSNIFEINVMGELYPLTLFGSSGPVYYARSLSPYVLLGLGFFHFNPKAKLNSQWVNLEPLHTEGEGFAEYSYRNVYPRSQVDIPIGIGSRYQLSKKLNLSLELVFRKLFTDYLDDVSTTYIDPSLFSKYLSGTDLANALALNNRSRPDPNNVDRLSFSEGDRRGNTSRNDHYFSLNLKVGYVFEYKKPNGL
jgi:hypothetical protein